MTNLNIATATSAELLAFFNTHTGGAQVKKFADRKTAERRVGLLIAEMGEENTDAEVAVAIEEVVALATSVFIPSYNHTVCPKCGSSEIYNGRTQGGLVVDEDVIAGCHSCDWEQGDRKASSSSTSATVRPAMTASLKLDRRIVHTDTGEVYANACQVWKAGLVSASQGDRLSSVLYGAAKKGDRVVTLVNGHTFRLFA